MAGSLPLKNDVQTVTQLPQSRRQVHDVLSAAESVPPISDSEVTCCPMTRPATLSSSATSSSNSTDFSSSSSLISCGSSGNALVQRRSRGAAIVMPDRCHRIARLINSPLPLHADRTVVFIACADSTGRIVKGKVCRGP